LLLIRLARAAPKAETSGEPAAFAGVAGARATQSGNVVIMGSALQRLPSRKRNRFRNVAEENEVKV